jgi:hypothetical protein
MLSNEKQYEFKIWENDNLINSGQIDDPFIHSTIVPKGWRIAWAVLRGKIKYRVHVGGTRAAFRAVFRSDYTPDPEGPKSVMGTYDAQITPQP